MKKGIIILVTILLSVLVGCGGGISEEHVKGTVGTLFPGITKVKILSQKVTGEKAEVDAVLVVPPNGYCKEESKVRIYYKKSGEEWQLENIKSLD